MFINMNNILMFFHKINTLKVSPNFSLTSLYLACSYFPRWIWYAPSRIFLTNKHLDTMVYIFYPQLNII